MLNSRETKKKLENLIVSQLFKDGILKFSNSIRLNDFAVLLFHTHHVIIGRNCMMVALRWGKKFLIQNFMDIIRF